MRSMMRTRKSGRRLTEENDKSPERKKKDTTVKRKPLKSLKSRVRNESCYIHKTPEEIIEKYPDLAPYDIEKQPDSDDENDYEETAASKMYQKMPEDLSNYYDEQEDEEIDEIVDKRTNEKKEPTSFSISKFLKEEENIMSPIEELRSAIARGSVLEIGFHIRDGFRNKWLTEVQLEEIAKNVERPNISMMQFFNETESATDEEKAAIQMGHMFLIKISLMESKSFDKLKASVNSISSTVSQKSKVETLSKRTLDCTHVIPATGSFPQMDLTAHYNKSNLVGDCFASQMIQFLMKLFKNALSPKFTIWYYSYRPKCVRQTDKHFLSFPDNIADELANFALDAVGDYLPDHLLHGRIDPDDQFVMSLNCNNKEKEVVRRRSERADVQQTMQQSIGYMLNYLRDYHYSIETGELELCKLRQDCTRHLSWKDVKIFRAECRKTSCDPDDFSPEDIIG
ncbi:hypothetical protein CAEBREN_14364 [Caenorhabditis brenneri]|uniref:Uncharacterized protein n=1 Tax=Caenorhabditis brenneri TaxID=135651 RepID=G0PGZ2_CAEBE|nr:hypothetical protein CAEBREN_14364 [Caenorhabditis brenneri]